MVTSIFTRNFPRILIVASIAGWMLSAPPASAILGKAFGGAMKGAFLGSLLDGREGAQTGAAIGAGIGVLSAVVDDAQRRDAEKASRAQYEQQKQQMEMRRQQEEQQRFEIARRSSSGGVSSNLASIPEVQPHDDLDLITGIQRSLLKMNDDPGTVDGTLSERTMAAIRAYQVRHHLLETGQPSPELLQHMMRNGG